MAAPGFIGLFLSAFIAPFRIRGNLLRFAPLATVVAWGAIAITPLLVAGVAPLLGVLVSAMALIEAIVFIRLRTRFGWIVGICCVLVAMGALNLFGPYLFLHFGFNKSNMEQQIVGTWRMNMDQTAFEMQLASDHTYLINYTGRVTNFGSGHWTLEGNQLVVEMGSNLVQKALVYEVDHTNLVMQDVSGRRLTWTK